MKKHSLFVVVFCVLSLVLLFVACNKASVVNPLEAIPNIDTLSERLDFPVKHLTNLPGDVTEGAITLINGKLGEISYVGKDEEQRYEITYRMKKGSEKIDGVYTEFKENKEITVKDTPIALRMSDGLVYVANWEKDGVSYAIYVNGGMKEDMFTDLLNGAI